MLGIGLLVAGILSFGVDAAAIEIAKFDVSILLDPDGTIFVTETIDVDFGDLEKHGIFRTLPVRYARTESLAGVAVETTYALRTRVLSVTDGGRAPLRFSAWPEDRNLFIRIGDPDRTVTGKMTYVITYRVQRAINRFESHDELYWNVTGNEWDWPIHHAGVRVHLPSDIAPEALLHRTFTGRFGSPTTKATERLGPKTYEAEVSGLLPGEGLTFVVGLPKGVLEPASAFRELWWSAADNAAFFLVALVPLLTLAAMLFLYLRYGRDPGRRTPIMVQYQPPDDLSPAEVGSLLDERIDTPDIVSTAIDLAVRGYLTIQEEEITRFLFLTNRDYRFEKLRPSDEALQSHERAFHDALFASGDSVLLSSLKNRFYTSIPSIRSALVRQMLAKGLFPRDPARVRDFYRGVAVAAGVLPIGLAVVLLSSGRVRSFLPPEPAAFFVFGTVCLLFTILAVRLFVNAMPAKTAKGARLARYCLGFQEFVTRVEKDRLERMSKEDPTLFERVLPFAVVLGCADEWAERFEGLLTEPPSWYRSSSFTPGRFDSRSLVSGLGRSMFSMGSTLTSQPRPSGGGFGGIRFGAGRGSSGFRGGGGGSGGGFGGGGGGSW
jgi:uncharacterized membrane protein YgcG